MRLNLLVVPLAMLAGCGGPSPDPPPARPASTADGYAAKVAALPAGQRAGVLLRAIRDAGQNCQQVVEATAASAAGNPPVWIATCDDKHRWVIVVTDDGTATVVDSKDVAHKR